MKTPIIILICLWFVGLLLISNKHGKPKEGKHNVFTQIVAVLIEASLLYWAGLFD